MGKVKLSMKLSMLKAINKRFEVLTAVSTKMAGYITEAAKTSETSVNFYQTTRRYNPEDSHLR
jgi:hypothetical protein